jgi:hypothetical protein
MKMIGGKKNTLSIEIFFDLTKVCTKFFRTIGCYSSDLCRDNSRSITSNKFSTFTNRSIECKFSLFLLYSSNYSSSSNQRRMNSLRIVHSIHYHHQKLIITSQIQQTIHLIYIKPISIHRYHQIKNNKILYSVI